MFYYIEFQLLEIILNHEQFNKNNKEKGYKVKYHIWSKTDSNILCQILVTYIPDSFSKDKLISLDPSLDIQDEINYFIDNIITSIYKLS